MSFNSIVMAGIGVPGAITVHPNFNFTERVEIYNRDIRTQGGQLNTYKIRGGRYVLTLPLNNMLEADANQINTWWEQQADLYISETAGARRGTIIVRINNRTRPMNENQKGRTDLFNGVIQMSSVVIDYYDAVQERLIKGADIIFILDDPNYGVLDVNVLG